MVDQKIDRLILGNGSCQFFWVFLIPDAGRPDKIYRSIAFIFAAGRPYPSIDIDRIDVAVFDN